ncbi:papain-like cysteine protease family protein [Methylorubrum sp. SB2]|uniref:papain-like cysteine protease family protein n=1 Tax=Methylorubrum subtropicum TaxID=3138812 RepID=UPI00313D50FD
MRINRRNLIIGSIASTAIGSSFQASALEECPAAGLPAGLCSALIDPSRFESQQVADTQKRSQWCWAACISMICKFHGYGLPQESIVTQMYGSIVDMPADDRLLTSAVNREWSVEGGKRIRISARTFSPALGTADVLNATVVDDLKNDRPMINGSGTHATVTARVDYRPNSNGQPQVFRVHVIDPWPSATNNSQRARFLDANEMKPLQLGGSLRYLASVKIEEI